MTQCGVIETCFKNVVVSCFIFAAKALMIMVVAFGFLFINFLNFSVYGNHKARNPGGILW